MRYVRFIRLAIMASVSWAGCEGGQRYRPPDGGTEDAASGSGGATTGGGGAGGPIGTGGAGGTGGTPGAGGSLGTGGSSGGGGSTGNGGSGLCAGVTALPAAPNLAGPKRGAYTGSPVAPASFATLRPSFKWRAVTPTCGSLTYQIQADDSCAPGALDSCAFTSPEVDASGLTQTTYTPGSDMKISRTPPVGAFYAWRVRACDGAQRCGSWSEVRYLHVARVREDINGDGFGDVLTFASDGRIIIYGGGAQFDITIPDKTLAVKAYVDEGAFLGDINGDGFGDIGAKVVYMPTGGPVGTVILGAADLAGLQTVQLVKDAGGPSTYLKVTPAGDFNGDGFADVIVQWGYGITNPQTQLRIYLGRTSLAAAADLNITGPYEQFHTLKHSGRIGDVNGDGFEDVGLYATDPVLNAGTFQVFLGGAQPNSKPDAEVATTSYAEAELGPVGDVNADGFDDAVLVQLERGYFLYRGSATPGSSFAVSWTNLSMQAVSGGFDINTDGYADFVVTSATAAPRLHLGTSGMPSLADGGLARMGMVLGASVTDHDGDGRPDFAAGSRVADRGYVSWLGSDGTLDPRSFNVVADPNASFFGVVFR